MVDYNCGGAARARDQAPWSDVCIALIVAFAATFVVFKFQNLEAADSSQLRRRRRLAPLDLRGDDEVSNFWDLMWLIVSTFVFIAYLLVLFHIVIDLFRDTELGGLCEGPVDHRAHLLPVLTALLYIVARGSGMAGRQRAAMQRAKSDTESYIRDVAGKSPADQIADAKRLLDAGTINQDEFAKLKAKALA